jgi:hypothetical protein
MTAGVIWKDDSLWESSVTVTKDGSGGGRVTDGRGLDCGTQCTVLHSPGQYTLTATPDVDSYFAGWGGEASACGRAVSCKVTVGFVPVSITATFQIGKHLDVYVAGFEGGSWLATEPSGVLTCNQRETQCRASFAPGDTVRLYTRSMENPSRAPNFLYWSGFAGCGTGDDCTITFGASDVAVTATFTIPVELTFGGTGTGDLATSPAGASCTGTMCTGVTVVEPGQPITFMATPAQGTHVAGWDATANDADRTAIQACGTATTCTITPTSRMTAGVIWMPDTSP